jgi:predicted amidohydrolase
MTPADSTTVTLGLVQMRCTLDPAENLRKAVQGIREAADRGAQIVCLQELFRSQYFCQTEDHKFFDLAEPVPGPSTELLAKLAGELGVVIIASLFEKRAEGLYHNTAAILDADGRYLGKYRKMHIPDDPQYYEKFYFTPGDLGFRAWDTRFGRIGVLICWDQWYPEAARLTAMSGAQREAGARSPAAGRLGNHPAEPRHCQRSLCLRGQSRRPRGRSQRGHRVLGRQLRLRPRGPAAGQRRKRRRSADCAV